MERRGVRGPRAARPGPRLPDPAIADDVTGGELDREVKRQLRTLSKDNADGVARHLVMVARLLDEDVEAAEAHAAVAVRRAGRVPAVREAQGLVYYRRGEWAKALGEFRTARRLSGSPHLLPYLVDIERALGRHDRALDLATSPEAALLGPEERVELAIVVSGVRRDLGQVDAAAVELRAVIAATSAGAPWAARLYYAYGETLLAGGDTDQARHWFAAAADADEDGRTDAAERLAELDGVEFTDLLDDAAHDTGDEPPDDPAERPGGYPQG